MEEFAAGQLDVLVATTIIESGIDNPHTNTLIIEDSQRLGLAQMYQLKGRVGRSSTQAYAYFMFPEHVSLTEEAAGAPHRARRAHGLGSGMRIAMRDLGDPRRRQPAWAPSSRATCRRWASTCSRRCSARP